MKFIIPSAAILAMIPLVMAGEWSCPVFEGGPGSDRVAEAKGYYEAVFNEGTYQITSMFTQGVKCNGLAYLAVNTVGYTTPDTPEMRQESVDNASEAGDGKRCVYSWEGEGLSYEYGYDTDFTCGALGGTATCACNIRDCDGNLITGGSC